MNIMDIGGRLARDSVSTRVNGSFIGDDNVDAGVMLLDRQLRDKLNVEAQAAPSPFSTARQPIQETIVEPAASSEPTAGVVERQTGRDRQVDLVEADDSAAHWLAHAEAALLGFGVVVVNLHRDDPPILPVQARDAHAPPGLKAAQGDARNVHLARERHVQHDRPGGLEDRLAKQPIAGLEASTTGLARIERRQTLAHPPTQIGFGLDGVRVWLHRRGSG